MFRGSTVRLLATVLWSLVTPLTAQTTYTVGPGGFATIQEAVNAASPGDVVQVHPGAYIQMVLDKGVTVRAITPHTVSILFLPYVSVPAGQSAHLVGIDMPSLYIFGSRVSLDECTFDSAGLVLTIDNSTVHLQDCAVLGNPYPLLGSTLPLVTLTDSEVTAIDSVFAGADGIPMIVGPTAAIVMTGTVFRGSGLSVSAGVGFPGRPALTADSGSTVWISDSTLSSDPSVCPISAPVGRQARCTLTPACGALPKGPLLGVERAGPLLVGMPFVLDFHTAPRNLVAVFANPQLGRLATPLFEQAVLLGTGTDLFVAGLLVADATGEATATWNVPAHPGCIDRNLWFQGVAGPGMPLQLSPIAGGVMR